MRRTLSVPHLDRLDYADRILTSRRGGRVCAREGCSERTSMGKPYCSAEGCVQLNPAAAAVLERQAELEAERKHGVFPAHGRMAQEVLSIMQTCRAGHRHVTGFHGRTLRRWRDDLGLSERQGCKVLASLRKAGLVRLLPRTGRGPHPRYELTEAGLLPGDPS